MESKQNNRRVTVENEDAPIDEQLQLFRLKSRLWMEEIKEQSAKIISTDRYKLMIPEICNSGSKSPLLV